MVRNTSGDRMIEGGIKGGGKELAKLTDEKFFTVQTAL